MDFRSIFTRTPVNSTAAIVVGKAEPYEPDKKVLTNDSNNPIAVRKLTHADAKNTAFINLTGVKFGRFTVLGLSQDFPRHWVVKCACGTYSTRTAKAIKNKTNTWDRCEHCRHLAHLKREDVFIRTGRYVDDYESL